MEAQLTAMRGELVGFAYRMLGSPSEAEDAAQETLLRAWKHGDDYDPARASLRTWVYRIATNVCLDMLRSARRRARAVDFASTAAPGGDLGAPLPESTWVLPVLDRSLAVPAHADRAHADRAHADRAHADRAHADRAHADRAHADRAHADRAHTDRTYADRTYADRTYADRTYADRTYADRAHADRAHAYADPTYADPADVAVRRETIRLAFVAALQHLPPRQRAVLILRDVLCWPAGEVAALLETTVPSVTSALQRARASLRRADLPPPSPLSDAAKRDLVERYADAFHRDDVAALVALLQEDVINSMPPFTWWIQGRDAVVKVMAASDGSCHGARLVPELANGGLALWQERPTGPGGEFEPFALLLFEFGESLISSVTTFLGFRPPTPHEFPPPAGARQPDVIEQG